MPTYVYECETPGCENEGKEYESIVPIDGRDVVTCLLCGEWTRRKIRFTGLTWAPTAGGMR